jgi:hypothetical protein
MNNSMSLYPVYRPKDPSRRYKGIAVVVVLHLFIGWAIVSGTARNALPSMGRAKYLVRPIARFDI